MKKTRATGTWGLAAFVGATILLGLVVVLSFRYDRPWFDSVHRIVPWLGLALSLLSFFVGHLSYPRVQNLKVYLLGYVCGVTGLGYFLLHISTINVIPRGPSAFPLALLTLVFINLLVCTFVPSFVKYRTTRRVTLTAVAVEALLVVVLRFAPGAAEWMRVLRFGGPADIAFWAGAACTGLVAAGSVWLVRGEFSLGGVLTGTAMLYGAAWTGSALHADVTGWRMVCFAAALLYLETGIMLHWLARMEHRVAYDPLLHIYNRSYCSRIISEQSSVNTAPPLAVAMIDIDHFKKVNDTHGHQVGDQVLYNTAQAVCREVVPDGVVCRYGGEELIVFFPRKTAKEIVNIMERVRSSVEKVKTAAPRRKIKVTLSCGISCRTDMSQSVIDVIHTADKALYRAKKGGRNRTKSARTRAGATKRGAQRRGS